MQYKIQKFVTLERSSGALRLILIFAIVGLATLGLTSYVSFDAACYYYQALLVAQGGIPYVSFAENKSPGIFFLLALPAYFSGWNPLAATMYWRLLELTWIVLVYRLAGFWTIERLPRTIAVFALWTTYLACFSGTYESMYVEFPETLLVTAAMVLVMGRRSEFLSDFLAGVLLGGAIVSRQTALIHLASCSILIAYSADSFRIAAQRMTMLSLGAVASIASVLVYASSNGWLEAWWYQAYTWNYRYLRAFGPIYTRVPATLGRLFTNDFLIAFGLAIVGWIAVAVADLRRGSKTELRAESSVGLLFLLGAIETSASGILFRHHFIPWLPAAAILLATVIARFNHWWRARPSAVRAIPTLLILATVTNLAVSDVREAAMFHDTDREQVTALADWIRAHSTATDRILAWGFVPQLYLASERHAASAHMHNLLLTNVKEAYLPLDASFLDRFERDMAASRPKFIFLFGREDINRYSAFVRDNYVERELKTSAGNYRYLEYVPTVSTTAPQ